MTINATVLVIPSQIKAFGSALDQRRADHPADQGMRRAGRQSEIPGNDIPAAGAHQRAKDDLLINDRDIDDPLADRIGHVQAEEKERRES